MKRLVGVLIIAAMLCVGGLVLEGQVPVPAEKAYAVEEVIPEESGTEDAGQNEDDKRLVITIVEDSAADMITEDAVPLADGPGRERLCATHVLLALLLLILSVFYVRYFRKYQKRLYDLRLQASRLELQVREEGRHDL